MLLAATASNQANKDHMEQNYVQSPRELNLKERLILILLTTTLQPI